MKRIALVLLLCLAAGTAVAGSNKWRLQVSGGAESDGTITMTLALDDGRKLPVNVAIKKGMLTIERQLMPAKPDADQMIASVTAVMTEYNKVVAQVTKEARDAK